MATEEYLLQTYGALVTVNQLAAVLSRSAEGLRLSLRRDSDWAKQLNAARVKVGRRIYFRTVEVARVFDGKASAETE